MSEKDRYLVADIVVGYYSRQNFRDSKLLAERHGLRKKYRTQEASAQQHARRDERSGSDSDRDSDSTNEPSDNTGKLAVANADGLCVPCDDHDDVLGPPLSLKTSMMVVGGGGGGGVDPPAGEGRGGGSRAPTLAERRRERRRERRQAHQEDVRRKEAERASERRRMRADKARRDREVARAVREAEDAERLRLLSEAQEAENAAAVPTRLLRTMQRKAAAAIAAVASGAGATAGVGVVDEPAKAGTAGDLRLPGVNFSQITMLEEQRDNGGPEQGGRGHQVSALGDRGDSPNKTMPATRRRSRKNVGHRLSAWTATAALVDGNEGVTALALEAPNAVATDAPERGKRKTKSRETGEGRRGKTTAAGHPVAEGQKKDRGALPRPLPGTKAAQAGSVTAADVLVDAASQERTGNKRTSHTHGNVPQGEVEANLTAVSSLPNDVGVVGTTGRPRRKPSDERAGEPRAVFTHRASSVILSTDEATGSGEAAGVLVEVGRGGRNGDSHQRRASSKGRVGSVLPA